MKIIPIDAAPLLSGLSVADRIRQLQYGPPLEFDIPDWETEGDFRDIVPE